MPAISWWALGVVVLIIGGMVIWEIRDRRKRTKEFERLMVQRVNEEGKS